MTDIETRLRDWKTRRDQLDAERDRLVREADADGKNIRQIGTLSGLSRTTVYKILGITAQILADAKAALGGINAKAYSRTGERVWVSIFTEAELGFDQRGELASTPSSEVLARHAISALRAAGLTVLGDWDALAKGGDLEITRHNAGNGETGAS